MRLHKVATFALACSLVLGGMAPSALAQDQRTGNQGSATVRVTTKSSTPQLEKTVKFLASSTGLKVRHPSKNVWWLTGQAKQIQSFQRMAGGMGLTLSGK